jgi:hypothetical protein
MTEEEAGKRCSYETRGTVVRMYTVLINNNISKCRSYVNRVARGSMLVHVTEDRSGDACAAMHLEID